MRSLRSYFLGSVIGSSILAGMMLLVGFNPMLIVWFLLLNIPISMVISMLLYAGLKRVGIVSEPVLK